MPVHRKALVLSVAFRAVARVRLRLSGREHRRLGSQKAAAPLLARQRGKRAAPLRSTRAPLPLPQKLRRRPLTAAAAVGAADAAAVVEAVEAAAAAAGDDMETVAAAEAAGADLVGKELGDERGRS